MAGVRAHPIPAKSVTIVGAGGNIGSQLVHHLGRMHEIGKVTLIDQDVYEPHNLRSQDIRVQDVGRPKSDVQAQRLVAMRSRLRVVSIPAPLETVPPGKLRADLILSCLDSRRARQDVSRIALRLGVPWIDAGIEASVSLARVSMFLPGPERACMECLWDERHYAALDQAYSCLGARIHASPTQAPSSLGALAAALQAIECDKFFSGGTKAVAFGSETVIDAAHHKLQATSFSRNHGCRLSDHSVWKIEPLTRSPGEVSVAEALELGDAGKDTRGGRSLRVEGSPFVTRLICSGCGRERALLRHAASLTPDIQRCGQCRSLMTVRGFDLLEGLEESRLPERVLRRSLQSIGLRKGDVFSVEGPEGEKHFEIVPSRRTTTQAPKEIARD
ncbi:MAG: ThiF family adenylyltransferase [Acidobacteria bacterium]|nr:ThiF family adenylyltransferase [Acidobacteriota bacterium]